ncbi:hypothetical protein ANDA3_2488 [plant metagenome]|uniref:ATP-grasp domain-containing protein n=2 Tax=root TaxID=1 RepID=A0A1C3K788_9BURK|nr:ATP-grasp domain-containing protein [Orrella dioscoreae]SBT27389.1 hypothetical protein ODI_03976 [Orrella dioscoreae]SOE50007.1 hypothetical protein ODI_R2448 [Orrella dioscoreae]
MTRSPASRIAALRRALTGDSQARLVWLCNFEVERDWAVGHTGIPGQGLAQSSAVVRRLQEQGFLLAEPGDVVITSVPADAGFLDYLARAGLPVAKELVVPDPDGLGPVASILQSPAALASLRALAQAGLHLAPMGVSDGIEALAQATGLPLAGPPAQVCVRVNSKQYSRDLAHRLGLREIPGVNCHTVDELAHAILHGGAGPFPLIVKDAYGVSGRGLLVLRDPAAARALQAMVARRAERTGNGTVHLLVERFLDKQADLTYQVTIARNGSVSFDFVKRALIHHGAPQGHLIPAGLTSAQHRDIESAALKLGAALHADGYFGVAGMDALIDAQGRVRPVVEINARLNLSSYQERALQRFLAPDGQAVGRQLAVPAGNAPLSFAHLLDVLGPLGRLPENGAGLFITCFGTANAGGDAPGTRAGRLYTLFFGRDPAALDALQDAVARALSDLRVPQPALH